MGRKRINWRVASPADIAKELAWRTEYFEAAWMQDAKPRGTSNTNARVSRWPGPIGPCGHSNPAQQRTTCRECDAEHLRQRHDRTGLHPGTQRQALRRRVGGTPERQRFLANAAIQNAVRVGLIHKATKCEHSGCSSSKVEAAHVDYGEPFCVRWLCRPHHYQLDHDPAYNPEKEYR
jgi:hypothetical protein